jgi:hypothetical protein
MAFPFDWTVTPFDSLCHFIETDFVTFLRPENLCYVADDRPYAPYVEDTVHGILFPHDFPQGDSFLEHFEPVRQKYARRIERLQNLLDSDAKVLMIRTDLTKEQAEYLRDLVKKKYPRLTFVIMALTFTVEEESDWGLADIRKFCLPPSQPVFWEGYDEPYRAAITAMGVENAAHAFSYSPDLYRAKVSCKKSPSSMRVGTRHGVPVKVRNDSAFTWYGLYDGVPDVRLSYHWLNYDRTIYQWDGQRTHLHGEIPPEESMCLNAQVQSPTEPGQYILQWDLVIEQVGWFSIQGWQMPELAITVVR